MDYKVTLSDPRLWSRMAASRGIRRSSVTNMWPVNNNSLYYHWRKTMQQTHSCSCRSPVSEWVLALRCRAREKNKLPGTRQETKRNTLKKCLPSIHFYGFLLTSKLSSVPPLIQEYCSRSSPSTAASSTVDKNWLQDVEEDWVICYSGTLVCLYGLLVEAITKNIIIP